MSEDWTLQQQRDASEIIERALFGEFQLCLEDMEEDLERLLAATKADFERWDDGREAFAITDAEVDAMLPEEKLAYVARLIYWLAIDYGVSTGVGSKAPPAMMGEHADSPAGLLRALNDVLNLPGSEESARPADTTD